MQRRQITVLSYSLEELGKKKAISRQLAPEIFGPLDASVSLSEGKSFVITVNGALFMQVIKRGDMLTLGYDEDIHPKNPEGLSDDEEFVRNENAKEANPADHIRYSEKVPTFFGTSGTVRMQGPRDWSLFIYGAEFGLQMTLTFQVDSSKRPHLTIVPQ